MDNILSIRRALLLGGLFTFEGRWPMKFTKVLFLLILVFFSLSMHSCVTRAELMCQIEQTKFTTFVISEPLTLCFPKNTPQKHIDLLVDASMIQLAEFEAVWGEKTRPVVIYFFNTDIIPCGKLKGDFWGCHYGPNGPIHVIMGQYMTASVLFHELIHHNYVGGDSKHEDIRWETSWEPKTRAIWKDLGEKHRILLSR